MFNKVQMVGRIVRDPEQRETKSETDMVTFSLAVNRQYDKEQVDFFNVAVFGNLAKIVAEYKKKGDLVLVEGSLQTRQYEKDGEKRTATNIVGNSVVFLPSKNDSNSGGDNSEDFNTEEVPF